MDISSLHPLVLALLVLGGLALVFGAILGFAAVRYKIEGNPIVDQIDNLLRRVRELSQCLTAGTSAAGCPWG